MYEISAKLFDINVFIFSLGSVAYSPEKKDDPYNKNLLFVVL